MLRKVSLYKIIVFLMLWVYYALNARYLNMPGFTLLRWIFPALLVLLSLIDTHGKIVAPPNILIVFMVATIPSVLVSADKVTSILKFISFIWVLYGCYIFFCYLNNRYMLQQCFKLLVLVLILYQILNIMCVVMGVGIADGRNTGITTNSNTLGVYANLAFWAVIYVIGTTRKALYKIGLTVLLITSIFAVIASGSRTAFVVLVINIVLVSLITLRRSILLLPCLIVTTAMVCLLFSGALSFLQITALDRLLEDGGMIREALWDAAISVWERHKLWGCGYTVSSMFNMIERKMAFHNSYLSFLAECGLWGSCVLGCGMLAWLHLVLKRLKQEKCMYLHHEFLISCLMVLNLLIAAWSESFLFAVGSTEGFTFWLLVAWLLAYTKLANSEV